MEKTKSTSATTQRTGRNIGLLLLGAIMGIALALTLTTPTLFGAGDGAGKANTGHKLVIGEPASLKAPAGREIATLAGGCFWAMQTEFQMLKGVDSAVAGYAGGSMVRPSYEAVCSGATGHAETIQIVYDPKVVSYSDLVRIFLTDIDPTTLNRQGNDVGTQYRSAIFYHSAAQREAAEAVIKDITAKKIYRNPIVTEVVPYLNFYPAEAYHQDYCSKNPGQGYCSFVVAPEVARFRKINQARLK